MECRGLCSWPGPASSTLTLWLPHLYTSSSWSSPNGENGWIFAALAAVPSCSSWWQCVTVSPEVGVFPVGSGQILCYWNSPRTVTWIYQCGTPEWVQCSLSCLYTHISHTHLMLCFSSELFCEISNLIFFRQYFFKLVKFFWLNGLRFCPFELIRKKMLWNRGCSNALSFISPHVCPHVTTTLIWSSALSSKVHKLCWELGTPSPWTCPFSSGPC